MHVCGFAKHIFMHLSSFVTRFAFTVTYSLTVMGDAQSHLPLAAGGAGIGHYNPTRVRPNCPQGLIDRNGRKPSSDEFTES